MRIFVVMGNDFPDAVFSEEKAAEHYCQEKQNEKTAVEHKQRYGSPRIYWRVYEFELR